LFALFYFGKNAGTSTLTLKAT